MAFHFVPFILVDRLAEAEYASRGLEPDRNTTQRAGLLAGIGGPVGMVVGLKTARDDAEAAASPGAGTAATKVRVPNLLYLSFEQATKVIEAGGLRISREDELSSFPFKDKVTSTDPPFDTEVDSNSEVKVRIGNGLEKVQVPVVVGLNLQQAESPLKEASLDTNVTHEEEASSVALKDKITRTDPPAGTEVDPNSPLKLFVGNGLAKVRVPYVFGRDKDKAFEVIRDSGLQPKDGAAVPSEKGLKNLVVQTTPAFDAEADANSEVVVSLGTGNPAP
jgi:eukaryotic-like serine/threonine-protein kinase